MAGVPGTGKTATLHEVMRQMRAKADSGGAGPFRYVEINALRLASPQHAYVQLYRVSHHYLPCMQTYLGYFEDSALRGPPRNTLISRCTGER